MKCVECGVSVHLTNGQTQIDIGLDKPVRVQGVEYGECESCGEVYEFVPRYPLLLRSTALELAKKPGRLTPKEIRFLREVLDLKSKDMANRISVDKTTYSKYENGKQRMDKSIEMLFRVVFQAVLAGYHYDVPKLRSQTAKASKMTAKNHDNTWTVELSS